MPPVSCYAEFINYQCTLANSIRLNLPFSVYGEGVFINMQNFVIIWLVWSYNKSIGVIEKAVFVMVTLALSYFMFEASMMTEYLWDVVATT